MPCKQNTFHLWQGKVLSNGVLHPLKSVTQASRSLIPQVSKIKEGLCIFWTSLKTMSNHFRGISFEVRCYRFLKLWLGIFNRVLIAFQHTTLFMGFSTQWTWIWVNFGRQRRTEKPGILQSMGSQTVGHDLVTQQHIALCLFPAYNKKISKKMVWSFC